MSQTGQSSKPFIPPLQREQITKVKTPQPTSELKQPTSEISEPETFSQLILMIIKNGIKHLPAVILRVLIIIAIVTTLNFIVMVIPTYSVQGTSKKLLLFIVFITASYNGVVQRTIFWSILLTVGRRMFFKIKREGFKQVKDDIFRIIPSMKTMKEQASANFMPLFITGCGVGFILANYLTRNNRLDKQSVSIVLALTIVGACIKQGRSLLVLAMRLFLKDVLKISKTKSVLEITSKVLLSGVSTGLLVNLVFALIKIDKGGYILGGLLMILAVVLYVGKRRGVDSH